MIKRERHAHWKPSDYKYEFSYLDKNWKDIELIYSVGSMLGFISDTFMIGREKGQLFYNHMTEGSRRWQKHWTTPKTLQHWLAAKVAVDAKKEPGERSVVYWWREEIKGVIDELERKECGGVPSGTSGVVAEA
jgi:hypothetical protein